MKNTIIIIFLIWLLSSSCTIENFFEKGTDYSAIYFKNDLKINIDGVDYEGVGVLNKKKEPYTIRITSYVDIDLLEVRTCNRTNSVFSVVNTSWIKPKQVYEFKLTLNEIEIEKASCVLKIETNNKNNPDNSANAFFDFSDYRFTLPGNVICNGTEQNTNGVSVCSASVNTIQRIKFQNPVVFSDATLCRVKDLNTMSYDVEPVLGDCTVIFKDTATKRMHKLVVLGFNKVRVKT